MMAAGTILPTSAAAAQATAPPPPTRAIITFGPDTITAEVAATPMARERGLMFREAVPPGTGMLFVFPDQAVRGFWMRNTLVDLDIAMLDSAFVIVDLHQRRAGDREVRDARAPFTYALEVPSGWFEAHGIGIGAVARIDFHPPQPSLLSTHASAVPTPSSPLSRRR